MKSLFESYKEMTQKTVSEAEVCPKCKKSPCECPVEEELKGNQHKLDKNKNGKLDSDDFKKLRKEEQEPPFDKPYTVTKNKKDNGAQKARALAQKALKTAIMQGNERYTSSPDKLKKQHFGMSEDFTEAEVDDMINEVLSKDAKAGDWISDFMKSDAPQFKGKSKEKLKQMALAAYYSKQRNEEVEQIDEISKSTLGSYIKKAKAKVIGSAQVMGMGSKMTGQKTQDKAEKTVEKRAKGINKAVDRLTREQYEFTIEDYSLEELEEYMMSEDFEQLDELSKTTLGNYVKKAAHNATMSRKIASDFEHMAARAKKPSSKSSASELEKEYKSKSWKRRDNVNKAVDRLTKEEVDLQESSQNAKPTVKTSKYSWGTMKTIHHGSSFSIPLHPEHHEAIAKLKDEQEHQFKTEDGKHWTARRKGDMVHFQGANNGGTTAVKHSTMTEETQKEETMLSFKEFIEEGHEYKAGRYVHKGSYGTSHDDPGVKSKPFWHTADKDEEEKAEKPAAEKAVKRGRGRPAGSKSGARQFGAASKDGSGADYTGYKLHLPNSNK